MKVNVQVWDSYDAVDSSKKATEIGFLSMAP